MTPSTLPLLPGSNVAKPVIGMLHLPALPGSPHFAGDRGAIRKRVLEDAEALVAGGVHALMMENFGDVPFFADDVPGHVVAEMTAIAMAVRSHYDGVPLGINVLRNDGLAAISIAAAVGAAFVRINVLTGARVTDQGLVQGRAAEVMRLRDRLEAHAVKVWADVDVKHSAALATRALKDEVDDTVHRGLADALIVSGAGTGKPTDPGKVAEVKRSAGRTPVVLGAGVSIATLAGLAPHADGFIVGTSLKHDGVSDGPVDVRRVREFMGVWREVAGA